MGRKLFARFGYLVVILGIILILGIDASACEIEDDQSWKEIYEAELFVSAEDSEYNGSGHLESLSISPKGRFALVFAETTTHHINLYDESCQFVQRYILNEPGKVLVAFDQQKDNLIIFPVRRHGLIYVDESGSFICSSLVEDASDLISSSSAVRDFQVCRNGKIYTFSSAKIFGEKNALFTVTDNTGTVQFEFSPSDNPLSNAPALSMLVLAVVYLLKKLASKAKSPRKE